MIAVVNTPGRGQRQDDLPEWPVPAYTVDLCGSSSS